jgi:hypothetical protein
MCFLRGVQIDTIEFGVILGEQDHLRTIGDLLQHLRVFQDVLLKLKRQRDILFYDSTNVHWRDGRLILISVASPGEF